MSISYTKKFTLFDESNESLGGIELAYTLKGEYIGDMYTAEYLCSQRGIQPELIDENHSVCSIGFSEKEQKWYGWSHRAIFGFGIGSTISKGDCGYIASTPEELIEDIYTFYLDISEESATTHKNECEILPDRSGIKINHTPIVIPMALDIPEAIEAIENNVIDDLPSEPVLGGSEIVKCGKGEWTAHTLDDAKQMAIDFANAVS